MTPEERAAGFEQECERLLLENGRLRDVLRSTLALLTGPLETLLERDHKVKAAEAIFDAAEALLSEAYADINAILDASPRPFEAARGAKSRRSLTRAERAIALHGRGLSASRIGMQMAIEDGQVYPAGEAVTGVRPYSEQQVRRWLRAKKG
jgi:hypothetical protein